MVTYTLGYIYTLNKCFRSQIWCFQRRVIYNGVILIFGNCVEIEFDFMFRDLDFSYHLTFSWFGVLRFWIWKYMFGRVMSLFWVYILFIWLLDLYISGCLMCWGWVHCDWICIYWLSRGDWFECGWHLVMYLPLFLWYSYLNMVRSGAYLNWV